MGRRVVKSEIAEGNSPTDGRAAPRMKRGKPSVRISQMELIYHEETKLLRRCLFDVQNAVGLGRQEEAYHRALTICFRERGVPFLSKPQYPLMLGTDVAAILIPDIVAWDKITVELKAVPRHLTKGEFVQLFDYLKCRGDRLGLLVNLGLDRVHIERVIYDVPQYQLQEDWSNWTDQIGGHDRESGAALLASLRTIYDAHRTGYGEEVTGKLLRCALCGGRMPFVAAPLSKAFYRGQEVDESSLDCLVIAGRILLVHSALFDSNDFNISRGLSYMKALNLQWGVAVNFGREILTITGLRNN